MAGTGQKERGEHPASQRQHRIHRQPQPPNAGEESLPPVQDDGPHCVEPGGVRALDPQADSQLHVDASPVRHKMEIPARRPGRQQTAEGHIFLKERSDASP